MRGVKRGVTRGVTRTAETVRDAGTYKQFTSSMPSNVFDESDHTTLRVLGKSNRYSTFCGSCLCSDTLVTRVNLSS